MHSIQKSSLTQINTKELALSKKQRTINIADTALVKTLVNTDEGKKLNIVFEKYPGTLHLYFNSIEKYISEPKNLISLTVCIADKIYKSNKFPIKAFIKPDLYVSFLIKDRIKGDLKIAVYISIHMPFDSFSSSNNTTVSNIKVTNTTLSTMQNNLIEEKLVIKPNVSFFTKTFSKLFNTKDKDLPVCRFYCSYIADTDTKMFNIVPDSLENLSKWVLFRRVAFSLMYEGFLNIKSEFYSFTWQRKYVKWYGYMLFILDYNTRTVEQCVDLSFSEPSLEVFLKRIIRFNVSGKTLEIECLDSQSFKKCADALYTIFPKIFSFIY